MSNVVPVNDDGTVSLTPEQLDDYVTRRLRALLAEQTMAQAGLSRRTPEELLAEHDLPVTPEVAALLTHVPEERRDWLLRVAPMVDAIRKGRPIEVVAGLMDHLNGHGTNPDAGQVGPAQASLLTKVA